MDGGKFQRSLRLLDSPRMVTQGKEGLSQSPPGRSLAIEGQRSRPLRSVRPDLDVAVVRCPEEAQYERRQADRRTTPCSVIGHSARLGLRGRKVGEQQVGRSVCAFATIDHE